MYSEYPPNWDKPATLSPILNSVTSEPILNTSPETSIPGVKGTGGLSWYFPWTRRPSGKLTPEEKTLIKTSLGFCISGVSTSL